MIYENEDGALCLMNGAEKVKEVIEAKKYYGEQIVDLLTFIYYSYSIKAELTRDLPNSIRPQKVIEMFNLFGGIYTAVGLEKIPEAKNLIDFFKDIVLTDKERTRLVYKAKLHAYREKLMVESATPDEDKRNNEGVEMFTKLLIKIEQEILANVTNKHHSGVKGIYMFEVPDSKNAIVKRHKLITDVGSKNKGN